MVRSSSHSVILLVPLSGALWMRNETINGCDGERLVLLLPACVQFLLFCFVLFCFYFCIRLLKVSHFGRKDLRRFLSY